MADQPEFVAQEFSPKPSDADNERDKTQKEILQLEQARVEARRKQLEAQTYPGSPNHFRQLPFDSVGLALSGGGIRSATISLGLLSALGKADRLRYIDYLSTVSGGSYIGAFLCSCYVPSATRGDVAADICGSANVAADPFAGPAGEFALNHLRQSGRHLLPGGAGDVARLAAIVTRSWLSIHFVIGFTLLSCFMTVKIIPAFYLGSKWALDHEAWLVNRLKLPTFLWPSLWFEGYPVSHWFIASWLFVFSAIYLFLTVASFWAFFMTRGRKIAPGRYIRILRSWGILVPIVGVFLGVVLFLVSFSNSTRSGWPNGLKLKLMPNTLIYNLGTSSSHAIGATGLLLAALSVVALSLCLNAERRDVQWTKKQSRNGDNEQPVTPESPRVQEDRVRYRLALRSSSWLAWGSLFTALALFDSIAQTIYYRRTELYFPIKIGAAITVAIPLVRQLLLRVPSAGKGRSRQKPLPRFLGSAVKYIVLAAALLAAAIVGVFWAVLGQWLAWGGEPIGSIEYWAIDIPNRLFADSRIIFLIMIFMMLLCSWGVAKSFSFLNFSSFSSFYSSSLRRAYLGASNLRRRTAGENGMPLSPNSDHIDDDIALRRYYADSVMAPLHLINVTVNDTASDSSNITQRDRRGKPLTISPYGYLYPDDAVPSRLSGISFEDARKDEDLDELPLSLWVGISGAAASTGMGQYGSLGHSLLAGLSSVRLGYWWSPGTSAGRPTRDRWGKAFVQWRLADEFTGKFPGTSGRRWYLTDGGHFENTGAYELIRRRVGLIFICDNGADPQYKFDDVVTLIRRVRIDFDVKITFLDNNQLNHLMSSDPQLRSVFTSVKDLASRAKNPGTIFTGPYAALARVTYSSSSPGAPNVFESTIVLIKPRICGLEDADLVAYAQSHKPFPQQTTMDQFFDEAQWESYFRLGQTMGDTLFGAASMGVVWSPAQMRPLPTAQVINS